MNAQLETTAPAAKSKEVGSPKKKIMLVDDDPAIRKILMRLLEEEEYLVVTAANGVEALAMNEATNVDLVLLDLNMPVKGGWETFEELTRTNPLLPVILITARPNQLFPALGSGVGALLEKPLDFVKLFDTIRTLMEEDPEERLARLAGQSAMFRYVPPIPESSQLKGRSK